jgi:glycosyltransferase involved in cell wall biosynthesis
MKIGVIASIAHRLPPIGYGPWEQIASTLTEGFVARGHQVTLFATADSTTSAFLRAAVDSGYEETSGVDAKVCEGLHNGAAFARAGEFDIIANHFDFMPLTYSRLVATPMVTTIHGFSSAQILPIFRAYDDIAHYVSISHADRSPELHYDATIHHGIPIEQFTYCDTHQGYLLFLGRIHPDKGVHRAIEVARLAGIPLIIAGIIQDGDYFRDAVEPELGGGAVAYVGPVAGAERDRLLGGAIALLHLVSFAEPFGLAVVEALATGTPVIASPLGALPEIVRHATTGFLVTDTASAVAAVRRINVIERSACREDAAARFSADRMIEDYLQLFERIVGLGSSSEAAPHDAGHIKGLFSDSPV